jgi:hypothetical protein
VSRLLSHTFRQPLAAGFAIPLLEGLVRNLSLYEELRELTPLGLALERHRGTRRTASSEAGPSIVGSLESVLDLGVLLDLVFRFLLRWFRLLGAGFMAAVELVRVVVLVVAWSMSHERSP